MAALSSTLNNLSNILKKESNALQAINSKIDHYENQILGTLNPDQRHRITTIINKALNDLNRLFSDRAGAFGAYMHVFGKATLNQKQAILQQQAFKGLPTIGNINAKIRDSESSTLLKITNFILDFSRCVTSQEKNEITASEMNLRTLTQQNLNELQNGNFSFFRDGYAGIHKGFDAINRTRALLDNATSLKQSIPFSNRANRQLTEIMEKEFGDYTKDKMRLLEIYHNLSTNYEFSLLPEPPPEKEITIGDVTKWAARKVLDHSDFILTVATLGLGATYIASQSDLGRSHIEPGLQDLQYSILDLLGLNSMRRDLSPAALTYAISSSLSRLVTPGVVGGTVLAKTLWACRNPLLNVPRSVFQKARDARIYMEEVNWDRTALVVLAAGAGIEGAGRIIAGDFSPTYLAASTLFKTVRYIPSLLSGAESATKLGASGLTLLYSLGSCIAAHAPKVTTPLVNDFLKHPGVLTASGVSLGAEVFSVRATRAGEPGKAMAYRTVASLASGAMITQLLPFNLSLLTQAAATLGTSAILSYGNRNRLLMGLLGATAIVTPHLIDLSSKIISPINMNPLAEDSSALNNAATAVGSFAATALALTAHKGIQFVRNYFKAAPVVDRGVVNGENGEIGEGGADLNDENMEIKEEKEHKYERKESISDILHPLRKENENKSTSRTTKRIRNRNNRRARISGS